MAPISIGAQSRRLRFVPAVGRSRPTRRRSTRAQRCSTRTARSQNASRPIASAPSPLGQSQRETAALGEVGMPELALDDVHRHPLAGELDRVRLPQLVLVPTSAQASLSRLARYADVREKVRASWALDGVDIGIT